MWRYFRIGNDPSAAEFLDTKAFLATDHFGQVLDECIRLFSSVRTPERAVYFGVTLSRYRFQQIPNRVVGLESVWHCVQ